MRSHIQGDLSAGQFANKLFQIGDGKVPENPSTGFIIMPCGQIVNSPDELLSKLPGQEYAYKSIDCILNDDEAVQYPIEFLNSIQTPDLQAHNLILKVGAPIMLIRNIDAPRLCNGTRLIVKKLMQHVIQTKVLTWCAKAENKIRLDSTMALKQLSTTMTLSTIVSILLLQFSLASATNPLCAAVCVCEESIEEKFVKLDCSKFTSPLSHP
ncbi:ATP-dependent DNA helicase [Trichonephila inaurata madagascariensis]|uniref:ATP-dependent DNA helicase n=1 Tax=Trichonephila inaurata madagascariensis TaxID=2747483 RepID=A0A8X7CMH2_9ARAC|nr:ATP-dependent DNA helicase [Trichonephila inaurata madagascariensis]